MKKKPFLTLVLLLLVAAQGIKANVYHDEKILSSWLDYCASSYHLEDNENHVIEIATGSELARLAWHVNRGYTYEGWTVRLTNDIQLFAIHIPDEQIFDSKLAWIPIGNLYVDAVFNGTFDGQGHTIRDMEVSSADNNVGLFAALGSHGVIKDLTIVASTITGYSQVGAVVGWNSGVVENCHVGSDVTVNGNGSDSYDYSSRHVGGVVGYMDEGSRISGCTSSASVMKSWFGAGGVVGGTDPGTPITIEDCLYTGNCIRVPHYSDKTGWVVGQLDNREYITNSYYTDASLSPLNDYDVLAPGLSSESYVDKGKLLKEYGDNGIKRYEKGLLYGNKFYAPDKYAVMFNGKGTKESPYEIASDAGWTTLGSLVSDGKCSSSLFFKMTADINVTTMVGSREQPFNGNFDGDGHELKCNIAQNWQTTGSTSVKYVAPFSWISDANIENVHVTGSVRGGLHTGGLVGTMPSKVSYNYIRNCRVSAWVQCDHEENVAPDHGGGIVGHAGDPVNLQVIGCLFDGDLTTSTGDEGSVGGSIIGWCDSNEGIHLTNCVEYGKYKGFYYLGMNWRAGDDVGVRFSGTDCYSVVWIRGEAEACEAVTNKLPDEVTLNFLEPEPLASYDVSRLVFAGNNSFALGNAHFVGPGGKLSFTVTLDDPIGKDYYVYRVFANDQELPVANGVYTLSYLPVKDAVIKVDQAKKSWTAFRSDGLRQDGNTYYIEKEEDLGCLAYLVNSGTEHKDNTYVLTTDLNLETHGWEPIGTDEHPFQGVFKGEGHTISNLGVYRPNEDYNGLFGCVRRTSSGAAIDGVHLYGATIVGRDFNGGIAGFLRQGVGVSNSTSDAKVSGHSCVGGLVGKTDPESTTWYGHADIKNCLYLGNSVTATGDYRAALIGHICETSSFENVHRIENSYFTASELKGVNSTDVYAFDLNDDVNHADAIKLLSDNKSRLADYDVTLSGRTIYRDGSWNTLCLPFDVTLYGSPLEGAEARILTGSTFSEGTLTLNFSDPVEELSSGIPYIVRFPTTGGDITNPTFTHVKIVDASLYPFPAGNSEKVHFMGNYDPIAFTPADADVLYVGGDNQLYYPKGNFNFNAFRAYFKLNGLTAADVQGAIQLNFDDEGETTDLSRTSYLVPRTSNDDAWYSLDGRKLQGVPTQKGLYIHNGKKIIIK